MRVATAARPLKNDDVVTVTGPPTAMPPPKRGWFSSTASAAVRKYFDLKPAHSNGPSSSCTVPGLSDWNAMLCVFAALVTTAKWRKSSSVSASTERSPSPIPTSSTAPAGPRPVTWPRTWKRYSSGKNTYASVTRAPRRSAVNVNGMLSRWTLSAATFGAKRQSASEIVSAPTRRQWASSGRPAGTSRTAAPESPGANDL